MFEQLISDFPNEFEAQQKYWQNNAQTIISNYTLSKTSYLFGCQPQLALQMPANQVIYILSKRFGDEKVRQCLNPEITFESPIVNENNTEWLKSVSMTGVNIRTIGSFWNLVKYALTLPAYASSIHLLPIWNCGVVASLYGIASWKINDEFFDNEISSQFPHLNTVEKQLKIVSNLLHLMGKTVGFDVVPHTDRYAEIALANPFHFEWLQRLDFEIVDHSDDLVNKVSARIVEFIIINGSLSGDYFPRNEVDFFDDSKNDEATRLRILFGSNNTAEARNIRRNSLINFLFEKGYEPVPATMAPPYRGLIVDPSEAAKTTDNEGRVWRDYLLKKPEKMSRVFGPLARYKLYESKNQNKNWELDFSKPRKKVFEYVAEKYAEVCTKYNFDFMRGDMSHVQMNPYVLDNEIDEYYDIHKYVKLHIQKSKPSFGYFAESFLVEDDLMAYGNEAKHLEFSNADSTLGNLQSYSLKDPEFYQEFSKYYQLGTSQLFKPNFTIFTADKDDPRFDLFFWEGNSCRYFVATFFKNLPSYSSLGFEMRDIHYSPAPNEHYTKLYVFQVPNGPKSTQGPFVWGKNTELYAEIQTINKAAETIFDQEEILNFELVSNIDAFENDRTLIWKLSSKAKKYLFITSFALKNKEENIDLNGHKINKTILLKNASFSKKGLLKIGPFGYAIIEC
jgi:hypothetical protein